MKKMREIMTALTSDDDTGAVRVKREEHEPISDERFRLIVNSATKIGISVAGAVAAMNIGEQKLLILSGAVLLFGLVYFGMRD